MTIFLGQDIHNNKYDWREWHIQAYIVMELRRIGYVVHGDTNGASKTPRGWGEAKAAGMMPGWPDLCVLSDMGRVEWIELKLAGGRLSKEQKDLHEAMRALGHRISVVYADCPAHGLRSILEILGHDIPF